MRIVHSFQNKKKTFELPLTTAVIGRPKPGVTIDIDLSPDKTVSRPHAKITQENGRWWIEDLGSTSGTEVNKEEIQGDGKMPLPIGSHIRIGETVLEFEPPLEPVSSESVMKMRSANKPAGPFRALDPNATRMTDFIKRVNISSVLPATDPLALDTVDVEVSPAARQQRLLYELLLQFGTDTPLDPLLQYAIEQLVATIPAAERGAILIRDAQSGQLLLKAHLPSGQPAVSTTLAEHAIACRGGFVWQRNPQMSASQLELQMSAGMYAPLLWKGEIFGVVCVDNFESSRGFAETDLELLVAAAQHIALAISNYTLHDGLRRNANLVERLLTNFSPAIRRRLLDRARQGRLRLGGEKSEVTILASDIRGFTSLTSTMDASDVVDMLNCYFTAQVGAIFRHDGTVDKFVGDGLLAVFGSPEHDDQHHAKAIRAAMAMQAALSEVNQKRKARGEPVCEIGIGVHCGEVLHGFIGSEERMEFTLIGDAVNKTARFCAAAQGGEVLISPEMHQRVWKIVRAQTTTIKTKHEGDWPAFRVTECTEKPVDIKAPSSEIKLPGGPGG
ncbi:MAG TPA: adenylate/guanylate cyclase domain-containing protein [Pirellulales bacterium]|jgi:adenylate cyclase